jgi:uncharacterized protein (UPF0261 family)
MAMRNIVVIGALDTKGEQILFLKECLEKRKCGTTVIDISMRGDPLFQADITSQCVAQLGGMNLEQIRVSEDRYTITQVMQRGATEQVKKLYSAGKVEGIIVVGGITMALLGSSVMNVLPFGVPKVIVCPAVQPVYVTGLFGPKDIVIMQSIVELAGLNELVKNVLRRAAAAVCGMAEEADAGVRFQLPKRSIAITQDGFSDQCARRVRQCLEDKGFTVYSFHSQGISNRAMEELIAEGLFDGVIDIVANGVIEEIFEGNRAGGPESLEAAGKRGIPLVLTPCGINITGCGPTRKHAEKYALRKRVEKIDELRWATRYNTEELAIGARAYAEKLNRAKGPVRFVVPLRGWGSSNREGSVLYAPEEDRVFVEELRRNLKPEIEIEEVDCNLEDPQFAAVLVENLAKMLPDLRREESEMLSK